MSPNQKFIIWIVALLALGGAVSDATRHGCIMFCEGNRP